MNFLKVLNLIVIYFMAITVMAQQTSLPIDYSLYDFLKEDPQKNEILIKQLSSASEEEKRSWFERLSKSYELDRGNNNNLNRFFLIRHLVHQKGFNQEEKNADISKAALYLWGERYKKAEEAEKHPHYDNFFETYFAHKDPSVRAYAAETYAKMIKGAVDAGVRAKDDILDYRAVHDLFDLAGEKDENFATNSQISPSAMAIKALKVLAENGLSKRRPALRIIDLLKSTLAHDDEGEAYVKDPEKFKALWELVEALPPVDQQEIYVAIHTEDWLPKQKFNSQKKQWEAEEERYKGKSIGAKDAFPIEVRALAYLKSQDFAPKDQSNFYRIKEENDKFQKLVFSNPEKYKTAIDVLKTQVEVSDPKEFFDDYTGQGESPLVLKKMKMRLDSIPRSLRQEKFGDNPWQSWNEYNAKTGLQKDHLKLKIDFVSIDRIGANDKDILNDIYTALNTKRQYEIENREYNWGKDYRNDIEVHELHEAAALALADVYTNKLHNTTKDGFEKIGGRLIDLIEEDLDPKLNRSVKSYQLALSNIPLSEKNLNRLRNMTLLDGKEAQIARDILVIQDPSFNPQKYQDDIEELYLENEDLTLRFLEARDEYINTDGQKTSLSHFGPQFLELSQKFENLSKKYENEDFSKYAQKLKSYSDEIKKRYGEPWLFSKLEADKVSACQLKKGRKDSFPLFMSSTKEVVLNQVSIPTDSLRDWGRKASVENASIDQKAVEEGNLFASDVSDSHKHLEGKGEVTGLRDLVSQLTYEQISQSEVRRIGQTQCFRDFHRSIYKPTEEGLTNVCQQYAKRRLDDGLAETFFDYYGDTKTVNNYGVEDIKAVARFFLTQKTTNESGKLQTNRDRLIEDMTQYCVQCKMQMYEYSQGKTWLNELKEYQERSSISDSTVSNQKEDPSKVCETNDTNDLTGTKEFENLISNLKEILEQSEKLGRVHEPMAFALMEFKEINKFLKDRSLTDQDEIQSLKKRRDLIAQMFFNSPYVADPLLQHYIACSSGQTASRNCHGEKWGEKRSTDYKFNNKREKALQFAPDIGFKDGKRDKEWILDATDSWDIKRLSQIISDAHNPQKMAWAEQDLYTGLVIPQAVTLYKNSGYVGHFMDLAKNNMERNPALVGSVLSKQPAFTDTICQNISYLFALEDDKQENRKRIQKVFAIGMVAALAVPGVSYAGMVGLGTAKFLTASALVANTAISGYDLYRSLEENQQAEDNLRVAKGASGALGLNDDAHLKMLEQTRDASKSDLYLTAGFAVFDVLGTVELGEMAMRAARSTKRLKYADEFVEHVNRNGMKEGMDYLSGLAKNPKTKQDALNILNEISQQNAKNGPGWENFVKHASQEGESFDETQKLFKLSQGEDKADFDAIVLGVRKRQKSGELSENDYIEFIVNSGPLKGTPVSMKLDDFMAKYSSVTPVRDASSKGLQKEIERLYEFTDIGLSNKLHINSAQLFKEGGIFSLEGPRPDWRDVIPKKARRAQIESSAKSGRQLPIEDQNPTVPTKRVNENKTQIRNDLITIKKNIEKENGKIVSEIEQLQTQKMGLDQTKFDKLKRRQLDYKINLLQGKINQNHNTVKELSDLEIREVSTTSMMSYITPEGKISQVEVPENSKILNLDSPEGEKAIRHIQELHPDEIKLYYREKQLEKSLSSTQTAPYTLDDAAREFALDKLWLLKSRPDLIKEGGRYHVKNKALFKELSDDPIELASHSGRYQTKRKDTGKLDIKTRESRSSGRQEVIPFLKTHDIHKYTQQHRFQTGNIIKRSHITTKDNRAFINNKERLGKEGNHVFTDSEFAILKELNDNVLEKGTNTAIQNHFKERIIHHMKNTQVNIGTAEQPVMKSLWDLVEYKYHDYKSIRFAFQKYPEEVNQLIEEAYNLVHKQTVRDIKNAIGPNGLKLDKYYTRHRGTVSDPDYWFNSGIGRSETQAGGAVKMARRYFGKGVKPYRFEEVANDLITQQKKFLDLGDQLRTLIPKQRPGFPPILVPNRIQMPDGSWRLGEDMILSEEAIEILRKIGPQPSFDDYIKSVQTQFKDRFGVDISDESVVAMRDYFNIADNRTAGIFIEERITIDLGKADHDIVSGDFVGMGAKNIHETMNELTQVKNLSDPQIAATEIVDRARIAEQTVTKEMDVNKKVFEDAYRKIDQKGPLAFSGDDGIAMPKKNFSEEDKVKFIQDLAVDNPHAFRITFLPQVYADSGGTLEKSVRGQLIQHAEDVEKRLRKELEKTIGYNQQSELLLAIDLKPRSNRAGGEVSLILNKEVGPEIQEAIDKAATKVINEKDWGTFSQNGKFEFQKKSTNQRDLFSNNSDFYQDPQRKSFDLQVLKEKPETYGMVRKEKKQVTFYIKEERGDFDIRDRQTETVNFTDEELSLINRRVEAFENYFDKGIIKLSKTNELQDTIIVVPSYKYFKNSTHNANSRGQGLYTFYGKPSKEVSNYDHLVKSLDVLFHEKTHNTLLIKYQPNGSQSRIVEGVEEGLADVIPLTMAKNKDFKARRKFTDGYLNNQAARDYSKNKKLDLKMISDNTDVHQIGEVVAHDLLDLHDDMIHLLSPNKDLRANNLNMLEQGEKNFQRESMKKAYQEYEKWLGHSVDSFYTKIGSVEDGRPWSQIEGYFDGRINDNQFAVIYWYASLAETAPNTRAAFAITEKFKNLSRGNADFLLVYESARNSIGGDLPIKNWSKVLPYEMKSSDDLTKLIAQNESNISTYQRVLNNTKDPQKMAIATKNLDLFLQERKFFNAVNGIKEQQEKTKRLALEIDVIAEELEKRQANLSKNAAKFGPQSEQYKLIALSENKNIELLKGQIRALEKEHVLSEITLRDLIKKSEKYMPQEVKASFADVNQQREAMLRSFTDENDAIILTADDFSPDPNMQKPPEGAKKRVKAEERNDVIFPKKGLPLPKKLQLKKVNTDEVLDSPGPHVIDDLDLKDIDNSIKKNDYQQPDFSQTKTRDDLTLKQYTQDQLKHRNEHRDRSQNALDGKYLQKNIATKGTFFSHYVGLRQKSTIGTGPFELASDLNKTISSADINFESIKGQIRFSEGDIVKPNQFNTKVFGTQNTEEKIIESVKGALPEKLTYDKNGRIELEITVFDFPAHGVGNTGVMSTQDFYKNFPDQDLKRAPFGEAEIDVGRVSEEEFQKKMATDTVSLIIEKNPQTGKPDVIGLYPGKLAPLFPANKNTLGDISNTFWNNHVIVKTSPAPKKSLDSIFSQNQWDDVPQFSGSVSKTEKIDSSGIGHQSIEILTLSDGKKVFRKTYTENGVGAKSLNDMINEAKMTQALEELGVGPKFFGLQEMPNGKKAILTEYIEGQDVMVSDSIKQYSFDQPLSDKTINEIRTIGKRLADNSIVTKDLQLRIDTQGKVYVIDPEKFQRLNYRTNEVEKTFNRFADAVSSGNNANKTNTKLRLLRGKSVKKDYDSYLYKQVNLKNVETESCPGCPTQISLSEGSAKHINQHFPLDDIKDAADALVMARPDRSTTVPIDLDLDDVWKKISEPSTVFVPEKIEEGFTHYIAKFEIDGEKYEFSLMICTQKPYCKDDFSGITEAFKEGDIATIYPRCGPSVIEIPKLSTDWSPQAKTALIQSAKGKGFDEFKYKAYPPESNIPSSSNRNRQIKRRPCK